MGAGQMRRISAKEEADRPPRIGRWILERLLPSGLKPTAAGDYEEIYHRIRMNAGAGKAAAWYWRHLAKSAPALIFSAFYWRMIMIGSYLKLAVRLMRRRPLFTAVKIGGLAVGLAGCILAFLYVRDEYAFDRFHPQVERIFEVRSEIRMGDDALTLDTQGPVGPTLAASFPEVEAATRLAKAEAVVRTEDRVLLKNSLGVDPAFFAVFAFPLAEGDSASALRDPHSVILGRETARQIFGSEDPLGKTLSIKIGDETAEYAVTGVAREVPIRSSLEFDLLVPIARIKGPGIDQWGPGPDGSAADAACFIRLREGARAEDLASRFPATLDTHLEVKGKAGRHFLLPFAEYHRGSVRFPFSFILKPQSSPLYSALLLSIAFLILLIAGFNFMNLSLGTAVFDRVKEIGLRKVFGAERRNLFLQFRSEGALTSLAALAGGFGIAALVLPAFNRFSGKSLGLGFSETGLLLPVLVLLALWVGIAAGSYPGWAMTRTKPADLFRGSFLPGRKSGFSRALLVAQFGISIFLITTAIFLFLQRNFLLTTDPGYEAGRVAVLDLRQADSPPLDAARILPVLKSRLLAHPEIQSVSGSSSALTSWSAMFVKRDSSPKPDLVRMNDVDIDFQAALSLRMTEGRWFSPNDPTGAAGAVVVNETFVRKFAPAQPVGKSLFEILGRRIPGRIIGVVRDFHFDSLRTEIHPAIISLGMEAPEWAYIRLRGDNLRRGMEIIATEFKAVAPGLPFVSSFLDEDTARLYESESRWSLMVGIVSLFAALIACSGVFGLAIQISAHKKKEIGIRKVLGASTRQIALLINGEFLKTAAVAGLLAWPASYLAVRKILAGYPYRIPASLWVYPAATAVVLVLIVLTVNLHALRAARANPALTLRAE